MTQPVYKELYEVMKARRGPYTGVDIPEFYDLMEELFTPPEAEVNNVMTRQSATAYEIAGRMDLDTDVDKLVHRFLTHDSAPVVLYARELRPRLRPDSKVIEEVFHHTDI